MILAAARRGRMWRAVTPPPWRPPLEPEALVDDVDVPQEPGGVEILVELVAVQHDLRVGRYKVLEMAAPVQAHQAVALDDFVGVLASQTRLDELMQHALREHQSVERIEVARDAVLVYDEAAEHS